MRKPGWGRGELKGGGGVWNERDTDLTAYSCSVISIIVTQSLESIKATMYRYLLDLNAQV